MSVKPISVLLLLIVLISSTIKAQETFPQNGIPDKRKSVYAIRNITLHVNSTSIIENADVVFSEGKILQTGKNLPVPPHAVVIDGSGKHLYPSFIDLFSDYGIEDKPGENAARTPRRERPGPVYDPQQKGVYSWNDALNSTYNAIENFKTDEKKAEAYRKVGFGTLLSHKRDGILRGTGFVSILSKEKENELILKEKAASGLSFSKGSSTMDYPSSLMGSIALLRQTYYDAEWYKKQKEVTILPLKAFNEQQSLLQIFEAGDKLNILRAAEIAKEFKTNYIIKGSGDEYQRLNEIKASGSKLIIPVNLPEAYDLNDPFDALNVNLSELKHWELAPYNLIRLNEAGIPFAITAFDLKKKDDLIPQLRKMIELGLPKEVALKALTETPAQWLGLSDLVGQIKPGALANFIITNQDIFDKKAIIHENWVNGNRFVINEAKPDSLNGKYKMDVQSMNNLFIHVSGTPAASKIEVKQDTLKLKTTGSYSESEGIKITFELPKKGGTVRMNAWFSQSAIQGKGQLPDGTWFDINASRIGAEDKDKEKKDSVMTPEKPGDLTYPLMAYGWTNKPTQETVWIKNATVWTNESQGVVENCDVIISSGKIVKVGKNLPAPAGNHRVIDATGKHLTPGLIDEHSHIAISSGVNEGTQSISSEVRIGDVVNSDDVNIYRQLAGGVTTSHLLHGSANVIGGQTALIKLRWGSSPQEMKFEGADGFIKFALGENVKQTNWGERFTTRYPQTRMGVEQVLYDGFTRAKEYETALKSPSKKPIRRDLELDALVEIMNKKRFITCHSYVQSEINMLMHVADSFGFKVNTFTHILEGYKVADKMQKHGAAGSTFADWWAYKYEVIEAIPHNAAMLQKAGVLTAINSDDAEMARRLNQEAAKALRYGPAISEEEALKMVTLNPAKMLHIDKRVGSVKEGKDADIVLWNQHPLSIYAVAEKTFVDGICYYDIEQQEKQKQNIASERARLIAKMNKEKGAGPKGKPAQTPQILEHCNDMEVFPHQHEWEQHND
jgi:imidazolonepropionase-like amidohydrolase